MGNTNARAHVIVSGRVQGVFYRAWCVSEAKKLGLVGWVRNADDGRVEAVFEGPKKKVEGMVEKCKKGSKYSKVEKVEVSWQKATGEFESFEILYN